MSEDQLQPEDTLDDHGVDDVLDEGYSPPDREPHNLSDPALTGDEETLDERLAAEEPEVWESVDSQSGDATEADLEGGDVDEVGDDRTGRLAQGFDGVRETDAFAEDVGIDGAGASAEEAAVHTIED